MHMPNLHLPVSCSTKFSIAGPTFFLVLGLVLDEWMHQIQLLFPHKQGKGLDEHGSNGAFMYITSKCYSKRLVKIISLHTHSGIFYTKYIICLPISPVLLCSVEVKLGFRHQTQMISSPNYVDQKVSSEYIFSRHTLFHPNYPVRSL